MIRVQVGDAQNLVQSLKSISANTERLTILQMSQVAYDAMQSGAGRHNKTGALFRSVYNRSIPKGREVGHDPGQAPHAIFVVMGTRPHEIRPKNKKALRWPSGGMFAFASVVKHPGTLADPYHIRAADQAVRQFDRIVNSSFKE